MARRAVDPAAAASWPQAPDACGPSQSDRSGLTTAQADERLATDGPNALPAPAHRPAWLRLARQLTGVFAILLWAAAGLSWLAGLVELTVAISVVVVVNGAFAFAQESRADHAAERLRSLLPTRVTVRRDQLLSEVDATQVVTGDVLVLEAGDRIPADVRILHAAGLLVDTSTLTGESEPISPEEDDTAFAGTFLVEGTAEAMVTATGGRTRLAGIARATSLAGSHDTPLTRELHRTVRGIGAIAITCGAAFFALTLAIGRPVEEGFILAIGVTVALVPEALLPTVTLALAWGAEQMSHRRVLVRSLDAVETLGSTTFVCTDKTGTLTRNEMTVVEAWTPQGTARLTTTGYDPDDLAGLTISTGPDGSGPDAPGPDGPGPDGARNALRDLARSGARCSRGYVERDPPEAGGRWRAHGDPMEAAIDVFARRLGVDTAGPRARGHIDLTFAFDPRRRRMSVVAEGGVLVKGAADVILPLCAGAGDSPGGRESAEAAVQDLTSRGLRVIAVASRPVGETTPTSAAEAEQDLALLGLIGLHDPPRTDVAASLSACRAAGVGIAMITGDHPVTAAAIATDVGLRRPEDPVLTGAQLPDDDAALGRLLDHDGIVVARVSPEDKLRIAKALRARGHVVAMTGDGVNDGPALREADIGVAMGASGTDVAREASDLVLLDDDFSTIVAGIELGRATYVNVRRFLTYHLSDNVAELAPFLAWGLSGGSFPLALGVLQILALDIGTDTLAAVALGAEPPAQDVLKRPPVTGRLLDRSVIRRAFGLLGPTEAAMGLAAFVVSLLAAGWRPGDAFPIGTVLAAASGATFMTVVLAQAANAFACRSARRTPWALGWLGNRLLPPAVAAGTAFSLLVLLVPPIAQALGHRTPSAAGWLVAVLAMAAVLGVDALDKTVRVRRARGSGTRGAAERSPRVGNPTSGQQPSPSDR